MQEISFRNDILPLKDKLFRLALRITSDRAEAEDVVQETLIRVWNKRDEWTQFGSVEAYCLTVARNLAIDRSERKDARAVELTPDMEEASEASGPYERLVNKERMALIHRLINELPAGACTHRPGAWTDTGLSAGQTGPPGLYPWRLRFSSLCFSITSSFPAPGPAKGA